MPGSDSEPWGAEGRGCLGPLLGGGRHLHPPSSSASLGLLSPFSLGLGAHSLPPSPSVWGAQAHRQREGQQVKVPFFWARVVVVVAPLSASIHPLGLRLPHHCQPYGALAPHLHPCLSVLPGYIGGTPSSWEFLN